MSLINLIGGDQKHYDPIHHAAERGNCEKVQNLIERWGVNIETKCAVINKTALFIASQNGHLNLVKYLISKGANVNTKDKSGHSALWIAACCGHFEVVQYLVHSNADITITCGGNNLINAALEGGSEDIFKFFVNLGVKINIQHEASMLENVVCGGNVNFVKYLVEEHNFNVKYSMGTSTPLHKAAENGCLEIVKYLVKKGANVNATLQHNVTALCLACKGGHLDVVRFLISRGANKRLACSLNLYTPLHIAVHYNHKDIVELLLKHNAGIHVGTRDASTPLHMAAKEGRLEIAKVLIENKAKLDHVDLKGLTPLSLAKAHGNAEMVQLLQEAGDTRNLTTTTISRNENVTPPNGVIDKNPVISQLLLNNSNTLDAASTLKKLIRSGNTNMIKDLIARGLDINGRVLNGETLLLHAVTNNQYQIVRFLVENGADINGTRQGSDMPLHSACSKGHLDIVKYLVQEGGDVNSVFPSTQRFPLYQAVFNNKNEIVEYLLSHNANVNQTTAGDTVLHVAVQKGNLELVKILVRNGAKIDARNSKRRTPLEVAEMDHQFNTVKFLKSLSEGDKRSNDDACYSRKKMKNEDGAAVSANRGDINTDYLPLFISQLNGRQSTIGFWKNFSRKANPTVHADSKNTCNLVNEIRKGSINAVKDLLSKGIDVNDGVLNGDTLLLEASRSGQYHLVKFLLERGADANKVHKDSDMPLNVACTNGYFHTVKLFVQGGADVNLYSEKTGMTPLHDATFYDQLEIAQYLLENNADVNKSTKKHKDTPLHIAAQKGYLDMVKLLVANNADFEILNGYGLTPLGMAVKCKRVPVVQFFKDLCKSLENTTVEQQAFLNENAPKIRRTSQHEAIITNLLSGKVSTNTCDLLKKEMRNGNIDLIKALIGRGFNVNKRMRNSDPLLSEASQTGHLEIVKFLVEQGANIQPAYNCVTPLYAACKAGYLDVVKYLIDKGADVNFICKSNKYPPAFGAVTNDRKDVLEYLISQNVDVNQQDLLTGDTLLHMAAERGMLGIVKILIRCDAKLDIVNKIGLTPLEVAKKKRKHKVAGFLNNVYKDIQEGNTNFTGSVTFPKKAIQSDGVLETSKPLIPTGTKNTQERECVNHLSNHSDKVNTKRPNPHSPLWEAARSGDIATVKSLVAKGANVNEWINGERLLHMAVRSNQYETVKFLVANRARVDVVNEKGFTPLYLASEEGHYDIVIFLLKSGADVNLYNSNAFTPLYGAVTARHLEIVRILLDNKSVVSKQFTNGASVLHQAAQNGDPLIFNALLQAEKMDVNIVNAKGLTPLYIASKQGHFEIVKMLISRIPDISVGERRRFVPLHGAAAGGCVEVARLLVNEGINIDEISISGDTALHQAAQNGHLDVVMYLVQEGVNVNIINNDGKTAMGLAAEEGHVEIVNFLIDFNKADASDIIICPV